MPSTIVELAKILCPSPAHLAKRVALALEVPSRASLRNVERPEIGDRTTCEQARKLTAGVLAPPTVLATIDIRSDGFPTIVMARDQLAAIKPISAPSNRRSAPGTNSRYVRR